ncbi:hypothetical protein [Candidatus Mesenet endosymbiont of Agriotes lineatus]|uniref:hypothetical protein n=1 Tax=Candidatus Mesenet endosymbiont of Agriotes lineatus TaxID=3077948 RepID=UPI0030D1C542
MKRYPKKELCFFDKKIYTFHKKREDVMYKDEEIEIGINISDDVNLVEVVSL